MHRKHSRDRTSALSDLMFLLLLSVFVIFATNIEVSESPFEGDVNPTRRVRIWRAVGSELSIEWDSNTIIDGNVIPSDSTDDGILWFESRDRASDFESREQVLTIYFAGIAARDGPGRMTIKCPPGAVVAWEPGKGGLANLTSNPVSQVTLRVTQTSIESEADSEAMP